MNSRGSQISKVPMGQTVVKFPFGGCAATIQSQVRRIRPLHLALASAGVFFGLLLLFR
jgi:hypothetical protein